MASYKIYSKAAIGVQVYEYVADHQIEWDLFPYSGYLYVEFVPEAEVPPTVYGGRRKITKLEYMNLFQDVELARIYSAAKVSPAIGVFIEKFNATTPEANGTAIDLDDPRTRGGLFALEGATLIDVGRAQEILNG